MNYYEHHIGDYDEATSHLTACEDGIYSRLIRKYYSTEKPLPNDLPALQRLVRARTREEKSAVVAILQEFFILEDDGWHQKRCDLDLAKYLASEPERELKKANEDNRLKRHREERSRLFRILTDAGQHAPWNIGTGELRELVKRATATEYETQLPPFPETAPATPATATQTPDTRHQTPVVNNLGSNDGDATSRASAPSSAESPPPSGAKYSTLLIRWERDRKKVIRCNPSEQTFVDWLNAGVTEEQLRVAYEMAVARREADGDSSPLNVGLVNSCVQQVLNPPKPRPKREAQIPLTAMTDAQRDELGRKLGIGGCRAGESRDAFIARIRGKQAETEARAA